MPIDESMMKDMKKRYGPKKGEGVYFAVETKRKTPSGPKAMAKHEDKMMGVARKMAKKRGL